MSRVTRGGSAPAGPSLLLLQQQQRRGRGIAGGGGGAREDGGDEGLGLFSRNHRIASVAAGEESDGQNGQVHPGRISVGQPKLTRNGMDDLLSAADMGKHDYDWLLTPPGTPLVSTLEARDQFHLPASAAPRSNLSARSTSTTTTSSRFAVHQQDQTNQPARPARSSSATRPSMASYSTSQLSSSSSGRTSMLNTSTASVSSSCRPSTPGNNRSSSSSRTRPSAPAPCSRPTPSRSATPSKARPAASPATGGDTPRPFHGSRPSTPTQRSHVPAAATSNSSNRSSMTPAPSRSSSRPSTPTRRAPLQSPAPARSPSVGRAATASSRTPGPGSRPSSPGARIRPPPQPLVVLPDFPLHAPPNMRTSKVPERPTSAGRARPGLSSAARASSHSAAAPPASSNPRRQYSTSSPVVTRGSCRLPDNSPKRRLQSNGHESGPPKPMLRESAVPKTTAAAADSTGFGRTISKKSLDMALRHMDIRQSMPAGGVRGASLFPQSIRSTANSKAIVPTRISDDDPKAPVSINGTHPADQGRHSRDVATGYINGGGAGTCENGAVIDLIIGSNEGAVRVGGRASEPDIYESSRYDAILLQEDAMNMSWLHSADAKPDQSPVFDLIRFETLPEPFVLL